jgi:hypothetical protein
VTGVEYAVWGLFGGFAVEGLEFAGAIRRTGTWPWRQPGEPGPLPLAVSVVIRLAIGSGLAAAAGLAGQVNGPFGALAVGVCSALVGRATRQASPHRHGERHALTPTGQGQSPARWSVSCGRTECRYNCGQRCSVGEAGCALTHSSLA